MKKAIYYFLISSILLTLLTGCLPNTETRESGIIEVELNTYEISLEEQVKITIDTGNHEYQECTFYLIKPSGIEIPFTKGSNCGTVLFAPKSLEILFDEGPGQYAIKIVGKDDNIISGLGYSRFEFVN